MLVKLALLLGSTFAPSSCDEAVQDLRTRLFWAHYEETLQRYYGLYENQVDWMVYYKSLGPKRDEPRHFHFVSNPAGLRFYQCRLAHSDAMMLPALALTEVIAPKGLLGDGVVHVDPAHAGHAFYVARSPLLRYAPPLHHPAMNWAVPNSCLDGPPSGPAYPPMGPFGHYVSYPDAGMYY